MLRNITLAALAAITTCCAKAIAQETTTTVVVNHQAPPIHKRSASPIFIMPPSYLTGLRTGVVSTAGESSPEGQTTTTTTVTSFAPAQPATTNRGEYHYHSAPLTVRGYYNISSPRTVTTIQATPVLEGYTSKNGKIKLLDSSTKGTSALNNKGLEMQERDLIDRSEFAPPGGVPRPSTF